MAQSETQHLTGDERKRIFYEVFDGTPAEVTGPEADSLRASITKTVAHAKANGLVVEIPYDFTE